MSGKHWSGIKNSAGKRKHEFNITIEYAYNLFIQQDKKCALTGELMKLDDKISKHTASLDRINSKIGYVEGNVQWVLREVNLMKNVLPEDKFISLCKKIAKYNPK